MATLILVGWLLSADCARIIRSEPPLQPNMLRRGQPSLTAVGAIAGLPLGTFTSRIFRRWLLRWKSRERQLIIESAVAVSSRFTIPRTIAIPFPVPVKFNPLDSDSIVFIPRQPSSA